MRFVPSKKVRQLRKEIKEKHELWKKLYSEESKAAEEFYG